MRHYVWATEDKKLELTIYPTEQEDEVGNAYRMTKLETRNLIDVLEDGLEILEEAERLEEEETEGE